ncbi:MAG: hypothetical protein J7K98_03805 [Candidatus Aenigmarchaeota archaeon]|nr:hypothetical protein [Candidatus Aenigmarchaeota archaeon]
MTKSKLKCKQAIQKLEEVLYSRFKIKLDEKTDYFIRNDGLLVVKKVSNIQIIGIVKTNKKTELVADEVSFSYPVMVLRLLNPLNSKLDYGLTVSTQIKEKKGKLKKKLMTSIDVVSEEPLALQPIKEEEETLAMNVWFGSDAYAAEAIEVSEDLYQGILTRVEFRMNMILDYGQEKEENNLVSTQLRYSDVLKEYVKREVRNFYRSLFGDDSRFERVERLIDRWNPLEGNLYVVDGGSFVEHSLGRYDGLTVLQGLYNVANPSLVGDYVFSINGVGDDGNSGWVYSVNGSMPLNPAGSEMILPFSVIIWTYVPSFGK